MYYTMVFYDIINIISIYGLLAFVLILVLLVIDVWSIVSAFKQEKKQEENQQQNINNFEARTDLEILSSPCTVSVTRGSSMMGAAMSCKV